VDIAFDKCPALVALLNKQIKEFPAFAPSTALVNSFDITDVALLKESTKKNLPENFPSLADAKLEALSKLFATKATPTKQDLEGLNLGVDNANLEKLLENDEMEKLVKGLGNINFFKDKAPKDIATEIEDKLSAQVLADLKKGFANNMTLEKFAKLVNRPGFNNRSFKSYLADDFASAPKGTGRRRAEEAAATTFSKTQVSNQGEQAKTQTEEKERQDSKKKSNDATTIAISTISIAVSAIAYLF